jgi:ATP-dependent RNA helicase DeaD
MLTSIERATRQPLTQMQLPTAEDVNATRLTRFDDAISAALAQSERIARFRDIIGHYVEHHDVPEADVAAALAVVAQGDEPLLLSPEDDRRQRFDRDDRGARDDGDRGDRGDRPERRERRSSGSFATYRIAVGKRHRVEPRQIVGALANEGGFSRGDFGAIDIRPDFSLVELPANLPDDVLQRLSDTRISGKLIELRPDRGGPGAARRREGGDDRPPRKPRAR